MNWNEIYNQYLKNSEGMTWEQYYSKYHKWRREDKQRNYKRNKDIIYHTESAKKVFNDITYKVVKTDNEEFFLDGNNLYLKYEDSGYNDNINTESIRPFGFIKMRVDDNMYLNARIPNIILDAQFTIDKNGNLYLNYV